MKRDEMVNERAEALRQMSDVQLVKTIVKYFDLNATMPGEKDLKDTVTMLLPEVEAGTRLISCMRSTLIETFSSLCIKEVKLTDIVVRNMTKKNTDSKGVNAADLPMTLVDTVQNQKQNRMIDSYEMNVEVFKGGRCFTVSSPSYPIGTVPESFMKNHQSLHYADAVSEGIVIATDHSNGKFANMSYRLLIDLGQNIAA